MSYLLTAFSITIAAGAIEYLQDDTGLQGDYQSRETLTLVNGQQMTLNGNSVDSSLNLSDGTLSLDYGSATAPSSMQGNDLTLSGGTTLHLIPGTTTDGKYINLLTNVGTLYGADGSQLIFSSANNAASQYFDTSQPGSGYWKDATLQLSSDGTLQMQLHNETVNGALTITARQTGSVNYCYYESISFVVRSTSSYASGGAIYGEYDSPITLSANGSVTFIGNMATASDRYADGGAIYGYDNSTITLSNNGSVTFSENTASGTSTAHGGAIYGYVNSPITLSANGSVTFSGNTATSSDRHAYGGAIDGSTITLSNNGSVTFSGNTATSSYSSAYGGAIDGSTITLSNNGSVTFSGNTASGEGYVSGGAIYGGDDSTITLCNNGTVTFSGNTASGYYSTYGGAIYGGDDSTITLSNNGTVTFSGNSATSTGSSNAKGGAIYGGNITLSNNGSVTFSGNSATATGYYDYAYGGAIYGGDYSTISLSNNGSVIFSENSASGSGSFAYGGAIYGGNYSTITLSANESVTFNGNSVESSYYDAYGGAICGRDYSSTITLSNNGSVTFSGNTASGGEAYGGAIYGGDDSTITLSDNESVSFSGNSSTPSSYSAEGGAIYGGDDSTITLSDNESVSFSGNTATSSSSSAYGGAIYGDTITLSDNGSVSFSRNTASGTSTAYGGAIRAYGNLSIQNNDSVLFEKNAEITNGSYRLRSIYAGGSGDVVSLSAAKEKSIEFRDSVYIASGSTVKFNEDYTGAAGLVRKQEGDIIFTGAYTEKHLNELLTAAVAERTATAAEIKNSRLTFVDANTLLYGGRLRVEDGAVYQGRGITAMEDSGATVRVQDAELKHGGYDLTFNSGTTLELCGESILSGNLNLQSGSTLRLLDGSTSHSGNLSVYGRVEINLSGIEFSSGSNRLMILQTDDASITWAPTYTLVRVANYAQTGYEGYVSYGALEWESGKLYVDEAITNTATWNNATGNGLWDGKSENWVYEENRLVDIQGIEHVILGETAQGNIRLEGEICVGNIQVKDGCAYILNPAEGAGLQLTGTLSLESSSSLSVNGDLMAAAVSGEGALSVRDSLLVSGAVQAKNLHVDTLVAGSLKAGSLQASSLTLTDADATNTIGNNVAMSGAVDVAGELEINGALAAGSLKSGSLQASSLTLTDDGADNSVDGVVTVSGDITSEGSLSAGGAMSANAIDVNGTLTAGSLQAASLQASSLTLTDANATNTIGNSVAMSGAVDVAGELEINGDLTAGSLKAGSLQASSLTLKDVGADNSVDGVVTVSGDITSAGSLSAGGAMSANAIDVNGTLTAGSLQAGSLQASSLTLTEADATNTIGNSVAMSGDITSAGSLRVDGAVDVAGSVQASSLTLAQAGAGSTVGGDMNVGSLELASGAALTVGGTLTAGEVNIRGMAKPLQAGSFGASTMNFDLDRAALESLGLGYGQTGTIAQSGTALAPGFVATLNGGTTEVEAAAYIYTISTSDSSVQLTADYAFDGLQVWYRGAWVGKSSWTDFYIGGFDAVDGVESIDLNGDTVAGANLYIAYETGVTNAVVTNGTLEFDYVDLGGGQFEIGSTATVITDELYGKDETLVLHDNATLSATVVTLGTLVLNDSDVTVKKATINAISGTEGSLTIEAGGSVTVKSDVTLTGLNNVGTLDLGEHALVVNALVNVGGNVTAGEVTVQSKGRSMAVFDTLEADKVTVTNVISTGNYTDGISVGDGSAIGELVAETLEVREGEVTLGRTSGSTEISLLNLDLQEDATLVLNQQTRLTVTNELSATEGATVQLHKGAGISYGEVSIANRKNDSTTAVNAYELSEGTISSLSNAHISMNSSDDSTIDWQLINSSVENTGSGTVTITNADNSLTDVYATHGNITILQQESLNLAELKVGASVTVSAYTGDTESPEYEARITVSDKVSLGAEATLNTDLIIKAGATLEMGGTVDMGSKLYLNSNTTLGGELLTTIQTAKLGSTVTLFTGIDALYFNGKEQTASITLDDRLSAGLYFSNLLDTDNRFYYMLYEAPINGDGMLSILVDGLVVPEPTTATLSLLALAALAARRRRTQEK